MATMKAIKKRISSVNNTKKIMKAMDLVSASKLQKAKSQLEDIRPLYENLQTLMDGVKQSLSAVEHEDVPFTEDRDAKKAAYIVITSDRGLCGGYNVNAAKEALSKITSNKDREEKIIAVGAKGFEYFRRRGKNVAGKYPGPSEETTFEDAEDIGANVISMYASGEVDEVYLVYTHFETILSHVPCSVKLLPVKPDPAAQAVPAGSAMEYDPDVGAFMAYAVPMYLNISIFGAMIESMVCEQAARMTSMDAAARNASEIIDDLTLVYNRKRQNMITQEITEIVSGANALQ